MRNCLTALPLALASLPTFAAELSQQDLGATGALVSSCAGMASGAFPIEGGLFDWQPGLSNCNAATTTTNDLKAKGYQTAPAGNAPAQRSGTAVQCKAGYEKEADVLVTELGSLGVNAAVEAIADPLPAGFDPTANCYVILGK